MTFAEFIQVITNLGSTGILGLIAYAVIKALPGILAGVSKSRKEEREFQAAENEAVRVAGQQRSAVYIDLLEKHLSAFTGVEAENRKMTYVLIENITGSFRDAIEAVNQTNREIASEERKQCMQIASDDRRSSLELYERMDKRYEGLGTRLESLIGALGEVNNGRRNGDQLS